MRTNIHIHTYTTLKFKIKGKGVQTYLYLILHTQMCDMKNCTLILINAFQSIIKLNPFKKERCLKTCFYNG